MPIGKKSCQIIFYVDFIIPQTFTNDTIGWDPKSKPLFHPSNALENFLVLL